MSILPHARAHWLTCDTIAWNLAAVPGRLYTLHTGDAGGPPPAGGAPSKRKSFSLTLDPVGLSQPLRDQYPHLAGYAALKLGAGDLPPVPKMLKGPVAVSASDDQGHPVETTGLQIAGVLDDLYPYTGPLGDRKSVV
jgi:pullulanase